MLRLVPPYVLTASSLDADAIALTLYDSEDFAALYHADKGRAIALVTAMSEPQRVHQALAYAAWLASRAGDRLRDGVGGVGGVVRDDLSSQFVTGPDGRPLRCDLDLCFARYRRGGGGST